MTTAVWLCAVLCLAHVSWHQVSCNVIEKPDWKVSAEIYEEGKDDMKKPPCSCGGCGGWTRVAHLNMDDPKQKCPSSLNPITDPVRGCGRKSSEANTCDSVKYSVRGLTYSKVCGRVTAIQKGCSLAFNNFSSEFVGIDGAYVSGVSLTHGPPKSRKHIWSFAGAMNKKNALYSSYNCPCSNTDVTWPHLVPPYVGNDYFCDTGSPYYEYWLNEGTYFVDDPLWNGKGCESYSSCCTFNSPPWFCKTLPQPTSDDLEMRLCSKYPAQLADKVITLVDVYVK